MKKFAFHFFTLLFFLALATATYFVREAAPLTALLAVIVSSIIYKVRNKRVNSINIILSVWLFLGMSSGYDQIGYIVVMLYILIAYVVSISRYREYDPEPKSIYPQGVEDFFKAGGS